jgi:predicted kinase
VHGDAVTPVNSDSSPRIFLFGPQAAGKSTLRPYIADWWRLRGIRLPQLGIEEAQRQLCPADRKSRAYRYDENGALILIERERLVQEALELLADRCRRAAAGGFIAELAHRQLGTVTSTLGRELFIGSLAVFLTAPLAVRLERNRWRGASRVPEDIVRAYPEHLSPEERSELLDLGSSLYVLETNSSMERTLATIEQELMRYAQSRTSALEAAGGTL